MAQYPQKRWYIQQWLKNFFMLIGMIVFVLWVCWIFIDVLFL